MAKKSPDPAPKETPFANNPFATLARDPKLAAKLPVAPSTPVAAPVRRPQPTPPARLTLRHEAVGRSGKVATRISGVPGEALANVAAKLAKALGCKSTVEGGDVLLEGSLKERASAWFEKVGDVRKLAGEKPPVGSPAAPPSPPPPALIPTNASGTYRRNVRPGMRVAVVLKDDQPSGELTQGVVRDLLTNSQEHPHGIKVRLVSGHVGRVKVIYE